MMMRGPLRLDELADLRDIFKTYLFQIHIERKECGKDQHKTIDDQCFKEAEGASFYLRDIERRIKVLKGE